VTDSFCLLSVTGMTVMAFSFLPKYKLFWSTSILVFGLGFVSHNDRITSSMTHMLTIVFQKLFAGHYCYSFTSNMELAKLCFYKVVIVVVWASLTGIALCIEENSNTLGITITPIILSVMMCVLCTVNRGLLIIYWGKQNFEKLS
jgi:hypothetical protein